LSEVNKPLSTLAGIPTLNLGGVAKKTIPKPLEKPKAAEEDDYADDF